MNKSMWILLAITLFLSVFITGCPKKTPPPPPPVEIPPEPQIQEPVVEPEPEPELDLRTIYCDFDKSSIKPDQQARLTDNAEQMRQFPDVRVLIEGHCDERGSEEYNLALGARRAKAVYDYMVQLGVDPARMRTISYGESMPVDPGHNEEAWRKNRRAHFAVIQK